MIHILEKGEKADPLWGMDTEIITDEMIDALQQGKRLYLSVNDEYAVVIKRTASGKTDKSEVTDSDTISRQTDSDKPDMNFLHMVVCAYCQNRT